MASLQLAEDVLGLKVTLKNESALPLLNEAISIYGETRGSPISFLEDAWSLDTDFLFTQLFIVRFTYPTAVEARAHAVVFIQAYMVS